jgi:hypothetical protein
VIAGTASASSSRCVTARPRSCSRGALRQD